LAGTESALAKFTAPSLMLRKSRRSIVIPPPLGICSFPGCVSRRQGHFQAGAPLPEGSPGGTVRSTRVHLKASLQRHSRLQIREPVQNRVRTRDQSQGQIRALQNLLLPAFLPDCSCQSPRLSWGPVPQALFRQILAWQNSFVQKPFWGYQKLYRPYWPLRPWPVPWPPPRLPPLRPWPWP